MQPVSLVREVGASRAAIQSHYDLSNDFYREWLDTTMTYSCALWQAGDTLEQAQVRKIDYHVEHARAVGAARVLDVGCGWGSTLRRLVEVHGVEHAVGLTLSRAQVDWINRAPHQAIEVREQSWQDHRARTPYDAIVSIGALEHFARPEYDERERVGAYREFFSWCRDQLKPDACMSLQTIAFGFGRFVPDTPLAEVFPESCLPRIAEVCAGFDRIFEVEVLRNDRNDYARTLDAWIANMDRNWDAVVAAAGREQAERYRRYLQFTTLCMTAGVFNLLRLSLRVLPKRPAR